MINGMSREKPALDLFRYMESAWSLYERMGDMIRKRGAQKPATDASHCMVKMGRRRCASRLGGKRGVGVARDSWKMRRCVGRAREERKRVARRQQQYDGGRGSSRQAKWGGSTRSKRERRCGGKAIQKQARPSPRVGLCQKRGKGNAGPPLFSRPCRPCQVQGIRMPHHVSGPGVRLSSFTCTFIYRYIYYTTTADG